MNRTDMGGSVIVGVGVDAVDIARFRATLERTPSMRTRLFTATELEYVATLADPVPSLAVRFAAREAVMKAMHIGLGSFDFHDVEVQRDESGAPRVILSGRAAARAAARGVTDWHVSLTHSDTTAIAYVVAVGVLAVTDGDSR